METATQACTSCGYENRPGKKFCGGCGSALAAPCACCGTMNPPNARFCDECGVPLTVGKSPVPPPSTAPTPPAPAVETIQRAGQPPGESYSSTSRGTTAVQSPPAVLPHEELRLVTAV